MRPVRVPFWFTTRQPLIFLLALGACGLSGWNTVTFFTATHPEAFLIPMTIYGLVLEPSKVFLWNEALKNLSIARVAGHHGAQVYLCFAAFLSLLCVVCGVGNLQQIDGAAQDAALKNTPEYVRTQAVWADANSTIGRQAALAEKMQNNDHLTASGKQEREISKAKANREAAGAKLAQLEANKGPSNVNFIGFIADLLTRERPTLADRLQLSWHVLLAVTLEALCIFLVSKLDWRYLLKRVEADDDDDEYNGRGPALRVVEPKSSRSRTRTSTAVARTQTGASSNRTQQSAFAERTQGGTKSATLSWEELGISAAEFRERCNKLANAIIAGTVRTTVRAIKKAMRCGQDLAQMYLDAMIERNVCARRSNGRVYPIAQAA